nr:MAG TPA: hypothetical protein [Caudoviricetes sp.]
MPRLTLMEAVELLEDGTEITVEWDGTAGVLNSHMLAKLAGRIVTKIKPVSCATVIVDLADSATLPVNPYQACV